MDSQQFDRLTRAIGSRRTALAMAASGLALLGLADAATAKKRKRKRKNCKKFKIRPPRCDGSFCSKTKISTCRPKYHRCHCREGTVCLPNRNCGLSCEPECPAGCFCATGDVPVCLQTTFQCDEAPPCSSTTDCRFRTTCAETECGPDGGIEKRCVPLCDLAP